MFAAFPLEGRHVRLDPITLKHVPGLMAAATADRLAFQFENVPFDEISMGSYVKTALGAPDQYPFAVVEPASGSVLGTARFMSIERWDGPFRDGLFPHALQIGAVWLTPTAPVAVLLETYNLLYTEAFDEWQTHRVSIRVDAADAARRSAVEASGATIDGVLRGQQLAFGRSGPRDIACYSVIRSEWPAVKKALAKKL
jgi:N-acetyltransferase